MQHDLRLAIHIGKHLGVGVVCKFGGTESLGISRAGQTVLAMLMELQIWHLPASCLALWGEGSEKGKWPLPTFLSGRKISPGSHLDARLFTFSLCATGAFSGCHPSAGAQKE